MKYGVDGLKRRRIGLEKSLSSSVATTSSSPRIESSPAFSGALPSSSAYVSVSVSVAEPESETRDESFFDRDLLDCSICIERLKPPIYQCQNGHVACDSCSKLTKNVCPSCQQPTGSIRCLILEKLIESLKEKCKNSDSGCSARLRFSERDAHEKICRYGAVSCPFKNCDFRNLPYSLFQDHVLENHSEHWVLADPSVAINSVRLKPKDRFCIVFTEQLCFVLHRNPAVTVNGNYARSLGDMCYISVLKVLSDGYAGDIPFKLKLKTVSPVVGGPSSTFTMETTCSIDDDDPEDFLRDDGFVVVAQDMFIEVEVVLFALGLHFGRHSSSI